MNDEVDNKLKQWLETRNERLGNSKIYKLAKMNDAFKVSAIKMLCEESLRIKISTHIVSGMVELMWEGNECEKTDATKDHMFYSTRIEDDFRSILGDQLKYKLKPQEVEDYIKEGTQRVWQKIQDETPTLGALLKELGMKFPY